MLSAIKNMRISKKLPIIMIIFVVFSAATTSFVTQHYAEQTATEQAKEKLISVSLSKEQGLNNYLSMIEQDIVALSDQDYVRQALRDFSTAWHVMENGQTEKLQNLYITSNPNPLGEKNKLNDAGDGSFYSMVHAKYHPWFNKFLTLRDYYDIFLFDPQGNLVYTVFKELDYATNMYSGQWKDTDLANVFKASKAAKDQNDIFFYDFKPYAPSHDAPASFISSPIMEDGRLIGVLAFQMPINKLNAAMSLPEGMGKTADMFLVGEDYLMRTQSHLTQEDTILAKKFTAPAVDAALQDKSGVEKYVDENGKSFMLAYVPVDFERTNWALISKIEESEMMASIKEMEKIATGTVLVIALLIGILSILYARSLTNPIVSMINAMKSLANGDLKAEIPSRNRKDEIGDMASAVQVFKENAAEMQRLEVEQQEAAKRAEEEKKQAMHKLADDFDRRTSGVIASLANAAEQMQSMSTEMSSASRQTSDISNTVAAAATQADANVQTVAAATEELTASAAEIGQQINSVANMARNASNEAESTSVAVNELQEMALSIGEVVGAIKDIAEQTNLLALNATIEAARAGEAGKGFAVVADEVKNLANETAKKTEEIDDRVTLIQEAITNSVSAMEKIIKSVQDIDAATMTVTSAVEEQNSATAEIGRNVAEASTGTQQVSENIITVRQNADETGQAAQTVLSAANDLAGLSSELQRQVNSFLSEIRGGGSRSKGTAQEIKVADANDTDLPEAAE